MTRSEATAAHARLGQQPHHLAAPPIQNAIAIALAVSRGGQWQCSHAVDALDGGALWVFQASRRSDQVLVLRPAVAAASATSERLSTSVGNFCVSRLADDPALSTLPAFLQAHPHAELLRYRPGKRATFSVGKRIAKVFSDARGAAIDRIYTTLAPHAAQLPFDIPAPLGFEHAQRCVWQQRCAGTPLAPRLAGPEFAAAAALVAQALHALHTSPVRFAEYFTWQNQQQRSARYFGELRQRLPAAQLSLDALEAGLEQLLLRFQPRSAAAAQPLHGSPHTQQWLVSTQRLALVDFDRAALGDPELDLATFLAEWDYEPGARARAVNAHCLESYCAAGGSIDAARLSFYRVHKHLAKALKASRAARDSGAEDKRWARKSLRNLARAHALLEPT